MGFEQAIRSLKLAYPGIDSITVTFWDDGSGHTGWHGYEGYEYEDSFDNFLEFIKLIEGKINDAH